MISVIIPVYNRPDMLKRAVVSVLDQSYDDFELIVVDDGSTESLGEIQELVTKSGHKFITIPRGGVAAARNSGIKESKGEWIALLDSDDYWHNDKLKKHVEFHNKNGMFLLSQSEEVWHRNNKRVNKKKYHSMASGYAFKESLERCCVSASSVFLHRDIFEETGGFDEKMVVCEDYDFWIRVTRQYEIALLPEELVLKFGGHEDQLSRSEPAMDRFRVYAMLNLLENVNELDSEQFDMVLEELKRKLGILRLGAQKISNEKGVFYSELIEALPNVDSKLFAILKEDIQQSIPQSGD